MPLTSNNNSNKYIGKTNTITKELIKDLYKRAKIYIVLLIF